MLLVVLAAVMIASATHVLRERERHLGMALARPDATAPHKRGAEQIRYLSMIPASPRGRCTP